MADDPKHSRQTSPRGLPIPRVVTEKGSARVGDRDRYLPKTPSGGTRTHESWEDDHTPPTTDPALYRAIRTLKHDLQEHAQELGELTTQVAVIHARTDEFGKVIERLDEKQDEQTNKLATISGQLGIIIDDRHRHLAVTETRAIVQSTTRESMADRVLTLEERRQKFWSQVWVKVVGGVFSGGVLVALVGLIASRC